MRITNPDLKRRIIELSYKYHLSHIGSCLTAVDIIAEIYEEKRCYEKFILSSGHAGLALYCALEKYEGRNAEELFKKHGVHPNRDIENGIYASTGSLGHGFPIALGMAIADKSKNVYCLISDGEMAEGSIYETFNLAKDLQLNNFHIYVNCNGYSAYKNVYAYRIADLMSLYQCVDINLRETTSEPFMGGLEAHYLSLDERHYNEALSILDKYV